MQPVNTTVSSLTTPSWAPLVSSTAVSLPPRLSPLWLRQTGSLLLLAADPSIGGLAADYFWANAIQYSACSVRTFGMDSAMSVTLPLSLLVVPNIRAPSDLIVSVNLIVHALAFPAVAVFMLSIVRFSTCVLTRLQLTATSSWFDILARLRIPSWPLQLCQCYAPNVIVAASRILFSDQSELIPKCLAIVSIVAIALIQFLFHHAAKAVKDEWTEKPSWLEPQRSSAANILANSTTWIATRHAEIFESTVIPWKSSITANRLTKLLQLRFLLSALAMVVPISADRMPCVTQVSLGVVLPQFAWLLAVCTLAPFASPIRRAIAPLVALVSLANAVGAAVGIITNLTEAQRFSDGISFFMIAVAFGCRATECFAAKFKTTETIEKTSEIALAPFNPQPPPTKRPKDTAFGTKRPNDQDKRPIAPPWIRNAAGHFQGPRGRFPLSADASQQELQFVQNPLADL